MAAFSKEFLVDGTNDNGEPTGIGTTSTTLHTVPVGVTDEVWVWLSNNTTTDRVVTIELGTTATTQNIDIAVPAASVVLAVPGIPQAASQVVGAKVDATANSVVAFGYANRIT